MQNTGIKPQIDNFLPQCLQASSMLLFSPQILLTVHWCEVNHNMKRLKIDTNLFAAPFIIIW